MNLKEIQTIYFLGIGGIGMSALARYFHLQGYRVCGYDRTASEITDSLSEIGIKISFEDDPNQLPFNFESDRGSLMIIYTPAIPSESNLLSFFKNNNQPLYKRSEVLGFLSRDKFTIAVAGTHGKTSVSTIITWLLHHSPLGCNAFLGGISKNLNSNLLINSESEVVVAEADEFDRSFLRLHPNLSVVTSVDADHLDIYGNYENLVSSFQEFINLLPSDGKLILNGKIDKSLLNLDHINYLTYSVDNTNCDLFAQNISMIEGVYHFDLNTPTGIIAGITMQYPGWVNLENCIAALTVLYALNLDIKDITPCLKEFTGVKRRFDYRIRTKDLVYIDDYAHHPEEIRSFLISVKLAYPDKKITGIFQPHLYSRTNDFASGFAQSLDLLNEIILLDIYPAREKPMAGVTSELIFNQITCKNKRLINKEDLMDIVSELNPEVLVTMGAGDIDRFVEPIKQQLLK